MSHLRDSRNARLLNRAFRKLAALGKFPNFSAIIKMLRRLIGRDKSGSIMEPPVFRRGTSFPIEQFNQSQDAIRLELELLFDEAVYLGNQLLGMQVVMEERIAELQRQIRKAQEAAERELLLAGSNFLDAFVIRFVDRDNVDAATTAEVDTANGIVTLPTRSAAARIIPNPVPDQPLVVEFEAGDGQVLPGSRWASVFGDRLQSWQAQTSGHWVRLRTDWGRLVRAGRFEIRCPDNGSTINLRTSHDGVNYIRVAELEVRGGVAAFVFEARDIRFIEFVITKPAIPGGQVITVDSVGLYGAGFSNSAELVTTSLAQTDGSTIKVVRVDTDMEVPASTRVQLQASGDSGPWRDFDGKILDFTTSHLNDLPFTLDVSRLLLCSWSTILGQRTAAGQRYNGVSISATPHSGLAVNDTLGIAATDVFGVQPQPADVDPRSIRLFRHNNWGFREQVRETTLVNTCKMLMDPNERRTLYRPVLDELHQVGGSTSTTLTTDKAIISGANITLSGLPDSQVLKVTGSLDLLKMASPPRGSATIFIEGTGDARKIRLVSTSLPAWTTDYETVFVEGVGEIAISSYDLANNQVYLDPRITIPPALVGVAIQMHLQTRDLTPYVDSITGNVITFSISLRDYEKVVISYNTPIDGITDRLVGPSVVVEAASGVVPVAGRDYVVRDNYIQVMSTGQLPPDPSAVAIPITVSFKYVQVASDKVSYWAWCTVPAGPVRVVRLFTPLAIDHDERATWTDPAGRVVDLAGATLLTLQPGTHRFSVVGRRAITDYDTFDTTSALYRLANLQAVDGGYLFGAKYFSRITGWPEPLVPVTRFWLERQAWNEDTEHFAWEDDEIMLALDPRRPPDAIKIIPGAAAPAQSSDWSLQYRYYHTSGVSAIQIKAKLSRDPGADPGSTPVIRGIVVKFTE